MKIIENTSDRLVIVERPWFLAAIMVLFTAAVVHGLATGWADMEISERAILTCFAFLLPLGLHCFVHWVRAEFDRTTGRVDVSRRGLFYDQHRTYALQHLKSARAEVQNHEAATWRAVLEFDKRMLAEMEPARRERLERLNAQGFRQAAANEAPLTAYYSSISNAENVAKTLNDWLGQKEQGGVAPSSHRSSRPPQPFVNEDTASGA